VIREELLAAFSNAGARPRGHNRTEETPVTPEIAERMSRLIAGVHARDMALEACARLARKMDAGIAEEIAVAIESMATMPAPIPLPLAHSQRIVVQQEHEDYLFEVAEKFRTGE
jgi:hypothetical protein